MNALAERFIGLDFLVRRKDRLGEFPSARDAYKQLVAMAAPSVLEQMFTSLIGSVDTMMVGTMGSAAIAAVGLVGQPWMILLAPMMGLSVGITAVVARRKGENRQENAGTAVRLTALLTMILSLILMVLGIVLARPFMILAGAKPDTLQLATDYFRIRMYAFPVNCLALTVNASQRGAGNTRITMYTNFISNGVNIVFNYMLIGGHFGCPALGVTGAAIATDIGMVCGCVVALLATLSKNSFFTLRFRNKDFSDIKGIFRPVMKVSSGAMVEQVCIRLGFLLFAIMIADLGTQPFAAHQVAMQFLSLSFCCSNGIAVAGTALVGYYLGKKRPDISRLFGRLASRISLWAAFLIAVLVVIFRLPLVKLFTDEAEVIAMSVTLMYIVSVFQPFQMSAIVMMGCLRGAGDTKYATYITLLCNTLVRPIVCAVAIYLLKMGLVGAWLASLSDIILRMILSNLRFAGGKWADTQL